MRQPQARSHDRRVEGRAMSDVETWRSSDDVPASSLLDAAPGLYRGVPSSVYHARVPGLVSKSVLDLIERSPAHYAAWLAGADTETTPAMEFGSAFHMASLEPAEYARTYAATPEFGDCRFKENKAARDAWRAANAGKKLLEPHDVDAIAGMCSALAAHRLAASMIRGGEAELTLRWTDADTGLYCKARADYYMPRVRMIVDVKTTEDARPDAFAKSVARFRYHVQAATYLDGFRALGVEVDHFVFLAIEKRPPYAIAMYVLDDDALSRGREAARRNMATLAACIEAGAYPGYSTEIETISLPRWA
jgi:hypothetical protein